MTNKVAFINMKGGVGKTTLCINIAYTLVKEFGKKVLIVDIDPQFNATQALMSKYKKYEAYRELQKKGCTINYILQKPTTLTQAVNYRFFDIRQRLLENKGGVLDLLPGDLSIVNFESSKRGSESILNKYLNSNDVVSENYDYILIDTPATYSIYSQSALIASDKFLVPISPDVFSGLGYSLLKKVMKEDLTLEDRQPSNLGIIFTLTKEKAGRQHIQESFENDPTFIHTLDENERIRTGKIENFIYDMASTKENIVNLTEEFINKLVEEKV